MRLIAFFLLMRRSSLLETNHRLRRTVLSMPLLATFFRKRLSSWSCDSFGRSVTEANCLTSFRVPNILQQRSPGTILGLAIETIVLNNTRLTFAGQPSTNMIRRYDPLKRCFDMPSPCRYSTNSLDDRATREHKHYS